MTWASIFELVFLVFVNVVYQFVNIFKTTCKFQGTTCVFSNIYDNKFNDEPKGQD